MGGDNGYRDRAHVDRSRYDTATAGLNPPFAIIDTAAFAANAADIAILAGEMPVRIASKSVRCRGLLADALGRPGFAGIMAYSLAEAVWLARGGLSRDILVGYPSADRSALDSLIADPGLRASITLMIDDVAQLDLIDSIVPPRHRGPIRVCLDLDASWRPLGGLAHVGVRRSPVHGPAPLTDLARAVVDRAGFRLAGLMCYEAQIAGLGDAPPGRPVRGAAIRAMQRRSGVELRERRAAAVAGVREIAELEFVNGGGTGSLGRTAAEDAVTELTAGSGLFGPALFDGYRAWSPRPAALFALSVVRRPAPDVATLHGGGWVASGPAGPDRLPVPVLPPGLRLTGTEGAGEVQTPVNGPGAGALAVGDRVWLRHAKAGELCERVNELRVVDGASVVAVLPTYRGEGKAFL